MAAEGTLWCASCGAALDNAGDRCAHCGSAVDWLVRAGEPSGVEASPLVGGTTTDVGLVLQGRYALTRLLGRGAMGEVYLARERDLDREVAIKFLAEDLRRRPEMLERFLSEARGAARVEHRSVVTIYTTGTHEGRPFIVMKYVRGHTVSALIRRHGRLSPPFVGKLVDDVCAGLALIHARGLVHRDIKPGNLMVDVDGQCLILDFGILRFADSTATGTGMGFGSPAYMSPEQAMDARKADARSDLYSLCVGLWEMLTGKLPYVGETPLEVILKHYDAPVPLLREVWPEAPIALEAFFTRALAKSPNARFQSATELATALRLALGRNSLNRVASEAMIPQLEAAQHAEQDTARGGQTDVEGPPMSSIGASTFPGVRATDVAGETTETPKPTTRRRRRAAWGLGVTVAAVAIGVFWWMPERSERLSPFASAGHSPQRMPGTAAPDAGPTLAAPALEGGAPSAHGPVANPLARDGGEAAEREPQHQLEPVQPTKEEKKRGKKKEKKRKKKKKKKKKKDEEATENRRPGEEVTHPEDAGSDLRKEGPMNAAETPGTQIPVRQWADTEPKPVRPPPAPVPAVSRNATLRLSAKVDGQDMSVWWTIGGQTFEAPKKVHPIKPGTYEIEAALCEGCRAAWSKTVSVKSGEDKRVKARIKSDGGRRR